MSYTFPPFGPERPTKWAPVDIIAQACQSGFMSPDDWRPITWCAVVLGESGGDPLVRGSTIWSPGTAIHLTHALGMFQLLRRWHVEDEAYPGWEPMTEEQCFDPMTAWVRAWALLNVERKGWHYNLNHWSAYTNGSYNRHISAAYKGMMVYRTLSGLPSPGPFALS